uniref:Uncharacterized protein n=1 Tax=Dunaliella tertiolecta TaxID=3047 RepID=A0A7S3VV86_DUNTE
MVFLLASSHGEPVVAVQTAMDQARQQLAHATGPVAQSACGTLMEQCMQRRKGFVLCAEGKFVTMQVSSGRGITGGEAVQSRRRRVHARRRMADSNPPDPH